MVEKYLICEDSLEGVFTGIYEAYARKENHEYLHIQIGGEENIKLFSEYISIKPDALKAAKVSRTIERELGGEAYSNICMALAGTDAQKGEAVYKVVVYGLTIKNKKSVMDNLANAYVHKVFEISRNVGGEIHRITQFLRFKELENGMLFAKIGPHNNILPFLMPHFANRLPLFNFVIYDDKKGIFAVHPASEEWFLVTNTSFDEEMAGRFSEDEKSYQELFTYFCHKISIKERENLKLQRNMLPLRFQEYMVEFSQ